MKHTDPLQVQVWQLLRRVQVAKRWALDLMVDDPTVSHWASGDRPMGLGALSDALRLCRAYGRDDIAGRIVALLDEPTVPAPRAVDPIGAVFGVGDASAAATSAIREALADGVISAAETPPLTRAADMLEDRARDIRDLVAQAGTH